MSSNDGEYEDGSVVDVDHNVVIVDVLDVYHVNGLNANNVDGSDATKVVRVDDRVVQGVADHHGNGLNANNMIV